MLCLASATGAAQGVVPSPMIQVRVQDESGIRLEKGRVEIGALKRWAYIERGQATLADLPLGTWIVSARVRGFFPESIAVEAALKPATVPVLKLRRNGESEVEERDTATFSPSAADSAILRAAAERVRNAHGTLIRFDDLIVRTAGRASDALRGARGFKWKSTSMIQTNTGCSTLSRADTLPRRGTRTIAIYVDGNRISSAIETLDRLVPPREILVVETYQDMIAAPARWRGNDACAAIAFWTKH